MISREQWRRIKAQDPQFNCQVIQDGKLYEQRDCITGRRSVIPDHQIMLEGELIGPEQTIYLKETISEHHKTGDELVVCCDLAVVTPWVAENTYRTYVFTRHIPSGKTDRDGRGVLITIAKSKVSQRLTRIKPKSQE